MRRMLSTLAFAAAALTPGVALAEYQPYAGQVGYFVTYQQAYGQQGYSIVHPGYSVQGYNWQTAQSLPAASARPVSVQPVYAPALEYGTAPAPYGAPPPVGWAPGYYAYPPPAYPRPPSAH